MSGIDKLIYKRKCMLCKKVLKTCQKEPKGFAR